MSDRPFDPKFPFRPVGVPVVPDPFPIEGSISHGTFRNEDLAETFVACLEQLASWDTGLHARDRSLWLTDVQGDAIELLRADLDGAIERDDDDTDEILGNITLQARELLEGFAPKGHYFGVLEGDSSDFGFWRIEAQEHEI